MLQKPSLKKKGFGASGGGGFGGFGTAAGGGFGTAAGGGGGFGTATGAKGGFGGTTTGGFGGGFGAAAGKTTSGFGAATTTAGTGFGASTGGGGFGFGNKAAGSVTQNGFGVATGGATKVGFGLQQGQGNGAISAQQMQSQMQNQSNHILTEEQQRQNKLDRILERQGKLEQQLPAPGVVEKYNTNSQKQQQVQPYSSSSTHQNPQTQYHQNRGQSLQRGPLTVSDPSRGRPLSSGIIGTTASGGRSSSLMSPEVLLGRRSKKLTIDHSQCEDLTEGLPSPYSKIASHKKELARSVDQALPPGGDISQYSGYPRASLSSSTSSLKRSKQEEEHEPSAPIKPQFTQLPSSPSRNGNGHVSFRSPSKDVRSQDGQQNMDEDYDEDTNFDDQDDQRSQCPRLTKDGYYTRPDMAILQAMSPPELASVPNFTVYVPNTGSITWRNRTDVRNLDLDVLVTIEPKAVTVYPEGTFKPDVGSGLNKSAQITLYNIFPKENASQSKQLNFVNKLRMSNDSTDATFESYSLETGTWVFSTEHFSKHGLADSDSDSSDNDDDEDGDDMEMDDEEDNMDLAIKLPPPSHKLHVKRPASNVPTSAGRQDPIRNPKPIVGGGIIRRNKDYHSLSRIKVNIAAQSSHEDSFDDHQRQLKGSSGAYAHLIEASNNYQPHQESNPYDNDRGSKYEFRSPLANTLHRKGKFKRVRPTNMSHANSKPNVLFVDIGKRSSAKLFAVEDSPCMRLMKAVKDEQSHPSQHRDLPLCSTSMRQSVVGRPQPPVDAAMYMGRSFRVGWSSDGKLLHMGNVNFNKLPTTPSDDISTTFCDATSNNREFSHGVLKLQTIDTMRHHGNDSFYLIPTLMSTLRKSSISPGIIPSSSHIVPLWNPPKANVRQGDEYVRFVNLLKQLLDDVEVVGAAYDRNHPVWIISRIVSFLDAMYGQEKLWIERFKTNKKRDFMMPLCEVREGDDTDDLNVSLWERRRELISEWLKSICEDDIDQSVADIDLSDRRPESIVLSLLCSGRVEDAVEVAERAHLYRLAMLLSQAGGDDEVRDMLDNQLVLWEDNDATEFMSEDMLSVYKILGGKYDEEMDKLKSVLAPLDWSNAIGVLFWYCNSSMGKLSDALEVFHQVRSSNEYIRHPLLRQDEDIEEDELQLDDVKAESKYHSIFRLLEVFLSENIEGGDVEEVESLRAAAIASLRPRGYSIDMLDYRGPFLTLVFLEATNVLNQSTDRHATALVRQHMVGQLLSEGEWGWAVFVCMQIEDPQVRSYAVRDLVLRFGGMGDSDECDLLCKQLKIPEELLKEASAYHHAYTRDKESEVNDLLNCGLCNEAATIICRDITPRALFLSSDTPSLLKSLLQDVEDKIDSKGGSIQHWQHQGGALLSYFDLKERVSSLRGQPFSEADENMDDELTPRGLVDDAVELLHQLTNNAFGLFTCNVASSSRRDYLLLANVVVNDIGTYLVKLIIIHYMSHDDDELAESLKYFLKRAPIEDNYRCEVYRKFPMLANN